MNHPVSSSLRSPSTPCAPSPTRAGAASVSRRPGRGWATRPLRRLVERLLGRLACGTIEVELPTGERLHGHGAAAGPTAALVLHRWRALARLLLQGDLGFGEAYREGDWSSPDLPTLLEFAGANESAWGGATEGRGFARACTRLIHRLRPNSRRGSRSNIAFHYDLGNEFYARWLDATMLYSSAWYPRGDETLEQAQAARLDRIVELLDPPPGAEVLEIGCGWGGLAIELARRRSARVTGLTLSARQLEWADRSVAAAGVADRVDLRLQDYRDTDGRYDRIVSIEMIEAVGQAYWPVYFERLRRCLKPGGSALLQAITIDEAHFEHYASNADFIQRHVFPGGMLPTVDLMREHAAASGLELRTELRFGSSYARTLADWRRRFLDAWPALAADGLDARFGRLWEYYLGYCEAGFRLGRIDVGLYSLHAPAG